MHKNLRRQFEMIFNEEIPKLVKEQLEARQTEEEVIILDFYVIFLYLHSCLHLIDKYNLIIAQQQIPMHFL